MPPYTVVKEIRIIVAFDWAHVFIIIMSKESHCLCTLYGWWFIFIVAFCNKNINMCHLVYVNLLIRCKWYAAGWPVYAYVKGCKSPMVVKFADTEREKGMKRLQSQQMANMNSQPGMLGMPSGPVCYFSTYRVYWQLCIHWYCYSTLILLVRNHGVEITLKFPFIVIKYHLSVLVPALSTSFSLGRGRNVIAAGWQLTLWFHMACAFP